MATSEVVFEPFIEYSKISQNSYKVAFRRPDDQICTMEPVTLEYIKKLVEEIPDARVVNMDMR